eukprot:2804556-Pleurochrysis_carterae.AAC.5
MRLFQEEQFGPVVPVARFSDLSQVVQSAIPPYPVAHARAHTHRHMRTRTCRCSPSRSRAHRVITPCHLLVRRSIRRTRCNAAPALLFRYVSEALAVRLGRAGHRCAQGLVERAASCALHFRGRGDRVVSLKAQSTQVVSLAAR